MIAYKYYWRRVWDTVRWMDKRKISRWLMRVRKPFVKIAKGKNSNFVKAFIHPILRYFNKALVRRFGNKFVEYEVTNICNARCIFCPYPDFLKTDKKFLRMDDDNFDKSMQMLEDLDYSLISFTPTTGDTLLHPNWDKMMARATELKSIEQITLYSNAIIMDENCREKFITLLKEDKQEKIFSLMFSVGGMDRETYKQMFQVDKFDSVVENVNELQKRLKEEGLTVGLCVKLRIPEKHNFDDEQAKSLFNKYNYPFTTIDGSKYFELSDNLKKFETLKYHENKPTPKKACSYLQKTRVAADGGVWADGCVMSEIPNDESLKLGHVSDHWEGIEDKRKEIISNWENKGEIPSPCQGCTAYRNDGMDPKYTN
jgi:wyosine [tRNA(Phe)-imidazoG37] synthetase (radical SAM superfamily)